MPPVVHVGVTKPPQAQAHVDRRDEPLPGQCLLGGRDDPGVQAPLTRAVHEAERSRSIAPADVTALLRDRGRATGLPADTPESPARPADNRYCTVPCWTASLSSYRARSRGAGCSRIG